MPNLSSAQLNEMLKQRDQDKSVTVYLARACAGHDDGLNKTERRFKTRLESLCVRKAIQDFVMQAWTFKLAHDCRYTPDALVVESDGTLTLYDVKGFEREDAVIKMRVAAERFPWLRFRMIEEVRKADSWRVTRRFNDDSSVADVA